FVISPVARPGDQIITQSGAIATVGGEIPGYAGQTWAYLFRPMMSADGTIFFLSDNGSSPWSLWRRTTDGVFTRLFGVGDALGRPTLTSLYAADGPFAVSPDAGHLALSVATAAGGASLMVDGVMRFGFGTPTGSPAGDAWRSHTGVAI